MLLAAWRAASATRLRSGWRIVSGRTARLMPAGARPAATASAEESSGIFATDR